ncbi:MAG TPA: hemerythrin domain-containing protein [Terriglobia bacterium]|nr:hemerythrin domain-containing protein [Terriglobia bacterium]
MSSPTSHRCGHHHAATPTAVLREEHEVILRALAVLERAGRDLAQGRTVPKATLESLANFFRTFADRCHHAKEEAHLFPALVAHGIAQEGGPVGVMLNEHEEGRALVRVFAEGDPATAVSAIRRFVTLLREHIAKENDVLFPMADQVLPQQEQREMLAKFDQAETEVAGPGVHERLIAELEQLEAATAK